MTASAPAPEGPPQPDIRRRTLTPFGYAVVAVVPVLVAAIGIGLLHLNYDPDDVISGDRVPILTSDWRDGDDAMTAQIAGELELGDDGCVHLLAADGSRIEPVWPAGFRATVDDGLLRLYDAERDVVARGGDQLRLGGGFDDLGSYAGRACAPAGGEVAIVQSEVTVTGP